MRYQILLPTVAIDFIISFFYKPIETSRSDAAIGAQIKNLVVA